MSMDIQALKSKEEQVKELLKNQFETEIRSDIGLSSYLIFRDGTLVGAYKHRDMMDFLHEKGVFTDEEINAYDTTIFNEVFDCVRCSDYMNDENYIGLTKEPLTSAQYATLATWIDNNVELKRKGIQVTANFAHPDQKSIIYDYDELFKAGEWPSDYIIKRIKTYYDAGKLVEDINVGDYNVEANKHLLWLGGHILDAYVLSIDCARAIFSRKDEIVFQSDYDARAINDHSADTLSTMSWLYCGERMNHTAYDHLKNTLWAAGVSIQVTNGMNKWIKELILDFPTVEVQEPRNDEEEPETAVDAHEREYDNAMHEELRKDNLKELISQLQAKKVDIKSFWNICDASQYTKDLTDEELEDYNKARDELHNIQSKVSVTGFYKGEPDPGSYLVWDIPTDKAIELGLRLRQEDIIHTQISEKYHTLLSVRYKNAQNHDFKKFDEDHETSSLVLIDDKPTGLFKDRGCTGWAGEGFFYSFDLYKEYSSAQDKEKFHKLELDEDVKPTVLSIPEINTFYAYGLDAEDLKDFIEEHFEEPYWAVRVFRDIDNGGFEEQYAIEEADFNVAYGVFESDDFHNYYPGQNITACLDFLPRSAREINHYGLMARDIERHVNEDVKPAEADGCIQIPNIAKQHIVQYLSDITSPAYARDLVKYINEEWNVVLYDDNEAIESNPFPHGLYAGPHCLCALSDDDIDRIKEIINTYQKSTNEDLNVQTLEEPFDKEYYYEYSDYTYEEAIDLINARGSGPFWIVRGYLANEEGLIDKSVQLTALSDYATAYKVFCEYKKAHENEMAVSLDYVHIWDETILWRDLGNAIVNPEVKLEAFEVPVVEDITPVEVKGPTYDEKYAAGTGDRRIYLYNTNENDSDETLLFGGGDREPRTATIQYFYGEPVWFLCILDRWNEVIANGANQNGGYREQLPAEFDGAHDFVTTYDLFEKYPLAPGETVALCVAEDFKDIPNGGWFILKRKSTELPEDLDIAPIETPYDSKYLVATPFWNSDELIRRGIEQQVDDEENGVKRWGIGDERTTWDYYTYFEDAYKEFDDYKLDGARNENVLYLTYEDCPVLKKIQLTEDVNVGSPVEYIEKHLEPATLEDIYDKLNDKERGAAFVISPRGTLSRIKDEDVDRFIDVGKGYNEEEMDDQTNDDIRDNYVAIVWWVAPDMTGRDIYLPDWGRNLTNAQYTVLKEMSKSEVASTFAVHAHGTYSLPEFIEMKDDVDANSRPGRIEEATREEFFKNSVVRNGDGTLMPVYHCSFNEFDTFDISDDDGTLDFDDWKGESGFAWFSESEQYAEYYGDNEFKYTCYLNITHPLDIGDINQEIFDENGTAVKITRKPPKGEQHVFRHWWEDLDEVKVSDAFINLCKLIDISPEDMLPYVIKWSECDELFDLTRRAFFKNLVIRRGYDGVTAIESGFRTWGCVKANQIKLVTNENPTDSGSMKEDITPVEVTGNFLTSGNPEGDPSTNVVIDVSDDEVVKQFVIDHFNTNVHDALIRMSGDPEYKWEYHTIIAQINNNYGYITISHEVNGKKVYILGRYDFGMHINDKSIRDHIIKNTPELSKYLKEDITVSTPDLRSTLDIPDENREAVIDCIRNLPFLAPDIDSRLERNKDNHWTAKMNCNANGCAEHEYFPHRIVFGPGDDDFLDVSDYEFDKIMHVAKHGNLDGFDEDLTLSPIEPKKYELKPDDVVLNKEQYELIKNYFARSVNTTCKWWFNNLILPYDKRILNEDVLLVLNTTEGRVELRNAESKRRYPGKFTFISKQMVKKVLALNEDIQPGNITPFVTKEDEWEYGGHASGLHQYHHSFIISPDMLYVLRNLVDDVYDERAFNKRIVARNLDKAIKEFEAGDEFHGAYEDGNFRLDITIWNTDVDYKLMFAHCIEHLVSVTHEELCSSEPGEDYEFAKAIEQVCDIEPSIIDKAQEDMRNKLSARMVEPVHMDEDITVANTDFDYDPKYLNLEPGHNRREESIQYIRDHWNERIWYLTGRYYKPTRDGQSSYPCTPDGSKQSPENFICDEYNGMTTFTEAYDKFMKFDINKECPDYVALYNWWVTICAEGFNWASGRGPLDILFRDEDLDNGIDDVDEDINPTTIEPVKYDEKYLAKESKAKELIEGHQFDECWYLDLLNYDCCSINCGLYSEFPEKQCNGLMSFADAYKAFIEFKFPTENDTPDYRDYADMRIVYHNLEDESQMSDTDVMIKTRYQETREDLDLQPTDMALYDEKYLTAGDFMDEAAARAFIEENYEEPHWTVRTVGVDGDTLDYMDSELTFEDAYKLFLEIEPDIECGEDLLVLGYDDYDWGADYSSNDWTCVDLLEKHAEEAQHEDITVAPSYTAGNPADVRYDKKYLKHPDLPNYKLAVDTTISYFGNNPWFRVELDSHHFTRNGQVRWTSRKLADGVTFKEAYKAFEDYAFREHDSRLSLSLAWDKISDNDEEELESIGSEVIPFDKREWWPVRGSLLKRTNNPVSVAAITEDLNVTPAESRAQYDDKYIASVEGGNCEGYIPSDVDAKALIEEHCEDTVWNVFVWDRKPSDPQSVVVDTVCLACTFKNAYESFTEVLRDDLSMGWTADEVYYVTLEYENVDDEDEWIVLERKLEDIDEDLNVEPIDIMAMIEPYFIEGPRWKDYHFHNWPRTIDNVTYNNEELIKTFLGEEYWEIGTHGSTDLGFGGIVSSEMTFEEAFEEFLKYKPDNDYTKYVSLQFCYHNYITPVCVRWVGEGEEPEFNNAEYMRHLQDRGPGFNEDLEVKPIDDTLFDQKYLVWDKDYPCFNSAGEAEECIYADAGDDDWQVISYYAGGDIYDEYVSEKEGTYGHQYMSFKEAYNIFTGVELNEQECNITIWHGYGGNEKIVLERWYQDKEIIMEDITVTPTKPVYHIDFVDDPEEFTSHIKIVMDNPEAGEIVKQTYMQNRGMTKHTNDFAYDVKGIFIESDIASEFTIELEYNHSDDDNPDRYYLENATWGVNTLQKFNAFDLALKALLSEEDYKKVTENHTFQEAYRDVFGGWDDLDDDEPEEVNEDITPVVNDSHYCRELDENSYGYTFWEIDGSSVDEIKTICDNLWAYDDNDKPSLDWLQYWGNRENFGIREVDDAIFVLYRTDIFPRRGYGIGYIRMTADGRAQFLTNHLIAAVSRKWLDLPTPMKDLWEARCINAIEDYYGIPRTDWEAWEKGELVEDITTQPDDSVASLGFTIPDDKKDAVIKYIVDNEAGWHWWDGLKALLDDAKNDGDWYIECMDPSVNRGNYFAAGKYVDSFLTNKEVDDIRDIVYNNIKEDIQPVHLEGPAFNDNYIAHSIWNTEDELRAFIAEHWTEKNWFILVYDSTGDEIYSSLQGDLMTFEEAYDALANYDWDDEDYAVCVSLYHWDEDKGNTEVLNKWKYMDEDITPTAIDVSEFSIDNVHSMGGRFVYEHADADSDEGVMQFIEKRADESIWNLSRWVGDNLDYAGPICDEVPFQTAWEELIAQAQKPGQEDYFELRFSTIYGGRDAVIVLNRTNRDDMDEDIQPQVIDVPGFNVEKVHEIGARFVTSYIDGNTDEDAANFIYTYSDEPKWNLGEWTGSEMHYHELLNNVPFLTAWEELLRHAKEPEYFELRFTDRELGLHTDALIILDNRHLQREMHEDIEPEVMDMPEFDVAYLDDILSNYSNREDVRDEYLDLIATHYKERRWFLAALRETGHGQEIYTGLHRYGFTFTDEQYNGLMTFEEAYKKLLEFPVENAWMAVQMVYVDPDVEISCEPVLIRRNSTIQEDIQPIQIKNNPNDDNLNLMKKFLEEECFIASNSDYLHEIGDYLFEEFAEDIECGWYFHDGLVDKVYIPWTGDSNYDESMSDQLADAIYNGDLEFFNAHKDYLQPYVNQENQEVEQCIADEAELWGISQEDVDEFLTANKNY